MKKAFSGLRPLMVLFFSVTAVHLCQAQTKVFKEIGEEMSSQIRIIRQDGALVGYVVFTQLEKANADSFNYKLTIMDENLNDIGTIPFREQKLSLEAVSFEQDVLCLAYLKSNFIGMEFRNRKEYKTALQDAKNYIYTQFVSLNGKIIRSNPIKADVKITPMALSYYGSRFTGEGHLKHELQLSNVSGKGFACFYGDETRNNLLVFNASGVQTWQKVIPEEAQGFALLTSGQEAYILLKKKQTMLEGGYELLGYNLTDSSSMPKYLLKDKQGNSLKALCFDNDPVTGKPYISGNIIYTNPNQFICGKDIAGGGLYSGVFTINVNGSKKGDINALYSYWDDGSKQPSISKSGKYAQNEAFARFSRSFRDYQGNTYFAGSSLIRRTRWGTVAASIITAPLIFPPIVLLASVGTQKCKVRDAVLVKQDAKGSLTFENSIPANNSSFFAGRSPLDMYDTRKYYEVTNTDSRTNYLIVDDVKDIVIYNVKQKKIMRTVSHKEGNISTSIFPAKEGYVMISEYNKKERYTRFSIESL